MSFASFDKLAKDVGADLADVRRWNQLTKGSYYVVKNVEMTDTQYGQSIVLHVCAVDSKKIVKVRCPMIFESKLLDWKYIRNTLTYVKNLGQKKLPNGNMCNDGYAAVDVPFAVSLFHTFRE